ncbi:MAG TPA: sensor histidine kinase [Solirubrobacteraceae bacterium]|nr:sensor histidine kinase [Solirubrobacteraceae bacterium]
MPAADDRSRPSLTERLSGSVPAGVAACLLVVAAVTIVIYPLQEIDPGVSSGVLYVLGVLIIAATWGLRLGLLTSLASAFALFVFHTSPSAGFTGAEVDDLVAIVILLVTSIVAAVIADRARLRAHDAETRLELEAELRARDAERIRLEEVQASRARVVAASDAERKRVVRDLHDGAQQRLVHTVVTLKLARRAFASGQDEAEARAMLDEALQHAESAIAELRELAHGIIPSVLARGGLVAGVEALADRMPIPVDVDVPEGRLPSGLESTAYFVVAEALTNVAKHAQATRADVSASIGGGVVRLAVCDDGVGGARLDGHGLTGLSDRLAVVGGALEVDSSPEGGTRLVAHIPLPPDAEPGADRAAA